MQSIKKDTNRYDNMELGKKQPAFKKELQKTKEYWQQEE